MDFDDFNPGFKQIAAAMAVVFLLITGLNALVAPDGGYAGDFADSVSNTNNNDDDDQPSENDSEDETDPYYDKATSDSDSDGDTDDSGSLNETEQTKIENDFEGHVNNTERDNGIYLDRRAVADEKNVVQVVSEDNPVEGAEVFVNDESVGTTGPTGSVFFRIPDADTITVRTTTENLGTVDQTYEVTG